MDFIKEAEKMGISVNSDIEKELEIYKNMMLEYNEKVNLTAITEDEEIREKHFLDSLALTTCEELFEGCSLIDIGAGAGFPSIPVKIARKDIDLTMLDSLNKRIFFLQSVIDVLALQNARAVHLRAEDGGKDKSFREKFDVATARAVADLSVLAEFALPFVNLGGYFIALKGGDYEEELERAKIAIKKLGGKTKTVKNVTLPSGVGRSLIVIEKISPTPATFPRKAGKPAKDPITK